MNLAQLLAVIMVAASFGLVLVLTTMQDIFRYLRAHAEDETPRESPRPPLRRVW